MDSSQEPLHSPHLPLHNNVLISHLHLSRSAVSARKLGGSAGMGALRTLLLVHTAFVCLFTFEEKNTRELWVLGHPTSEQMSFTTREVWT